MFCKYDFNTKKMLTQTSNVCYYKQNKHQNDVGKEKQHENQTGFKKDLSCNG